MIHFEYDGASVLFFKVFDEEGCRLSAALKEVTRITLRRAWVPPLVLPAAPPTTAATRGGPATLLSP